MEATLERPPTTTEPVVVVDQPKEKSQEEALMERLAKLSNGIPEPSRPLQEADSGSGGGIPTTLAPQSVKVDENPPVVATAPAENSLIVSFKGLRLGCRELIARMNDSESLSCCANPLVFPLISINRIHI